MSNTCAGLPRNTEENFDQVIDEKEVLTGRPEARTAYLCLHNYSEHGIEVSTEPDSAPTIFMPWGSVMAIYGSSSRQELVEEAKEAMPRQQSEEPEETAP